MSFSKLNSDWSNLASLYNQRFNNKPEVPLIGYSNFDDGLIRGGLINAELASGIDGIRVGKFMTSPKGILFVTKQIGLQLANPPLESQGEIKITSDPKNADQKISTLSYKKDNPTRSYLGFNTLLQVPINAFGGHIIRHGSSPIGGVGFLENNTNNIDGYNYEKITKENNRLSVQSINSTSSTTKSTSSTQKTSSTELDIGGRKYTNNIIAKNQKEADAKQAELIAKGIIPDVTNSQNREMSTVVIQSPTSGLLSYDKAANRLLQHLKTISKPHPKLQFNQQTLQSYDGGANSVYGLGRTEIKTSVDQRTNIFGKKDSKTLLLNGFDADGYQKLDSYSSKISVNRQSSSDNHIDLITQDIMVGKNETSFNDVYNIEKRVGVSRVGKSDKRSIDSINTISILNNGTFVTFAATPNILNSQSKLFTYTNNTTGKSNGGSFARDIIKFRIEFINNNRAGNFTEVLVFRAYIDDFSDGMSAKWNPYRYMGRGEEFYVYDGFTRDISLSFTIYAHSPEEMKPLYQKLNYLMSSFAPDYNDKLKMRGNIAKLTVGDYIYEQPGIFTDIKLSGFLDTHWEIAIDEPENGSSSNQYEVPKHIKVGLSFKPIHNFLPRRVMADNPNRAPFVTRNDANNKYLKQDKNLQLAVTSEKQAAELYTQTALNILGFNP